MNRALLAVVSCVLGAACTATSSDADLEAVPTPGNTRRRTYVCQRAGEPLKLDGRLNDASWETAAWTEPFADISGPGFPEPRHRTRAKMLWDDDHLYLGAFLEETDVWATLTERDSIIFFDNDFEIFIDPDGDTHYYYELEVNALATEWDLLLGMPYRDGGPAINGWDIQGLVTKVHVDGTLNDPSDTDRGWSIEIAIPWIALQEAAYCNCPPEPGQCWWINFSRVEWRTRVEDGRTVKEINPETGSPVTEDNWVWSPQGLINMHYPERWGLVQFSALVSGAGEEEFDPPYDLAARALLHRLYYRQRTLLDETGRYASRWTDLSLDDEPLSDWTWPPEIAVAGHTWVASLQHRSGRSLSITHQGRIR